MTKFLLAVCNVYILLGAGRVLCFTRIIPGPLRSFDYLNSENWYENTSVKTLTSSSRLRLHASNNKSQGESEDEEKESQPKKQPQNINNNDNNSNNEDDPKQSTTTNDSNQQKNEQEKARKKTQVAKAAAQLIKRKNNEEETKTGLFDKLNPFQAGQNLRKSLDSALTSLARANSGTGVTSGSRSSPYYLDDRFQESGGALFDQETNPYLSRLEKEAYIPEVLVVGATGEVGRLVVRRLMLEGRSRVRVLVRNLYSTTLNMLGTGVTYCQGDLNNMDSLEYALTDVDKIVMCAAAPRPDEKGFQEKFFGFAEDNLKMQEQLALNEIESLQYRRGATEEEVTETDMEWERLDSVMKVRARLAEQVDFVGMQNLVKAYQNVRHADYGTSQAAKRSLFKFQDRPDDFNLFMLDDDDSDVVDSSTIGATVDTVTQKAPQRQGEKTTKGAPEYPDEFDEYADVFDEYADEFGKYADAYDDYEEGNDMNGAGIPRTTTNTVEKRQDTSVKSQVQWIRNEFGHAVFVGKVPKATPGGVGGAASVISSRFRSREGRPDDGIDLSGGFGGFVCRVCADGGIYEAFVRTALYEEKGIEYVCEFSTASKRPRKGNASRNRFITVRLPFEAFKPVQRRASTSTENPNEIDSFQGRDVQYLGFRYRSSRNVNALRTKLQGGEMNSFYLALSYIKLFRTQPEPEFVYLSDARIPPVIQDGQVRHDIQQIVPFESLSSALSEVGGFKLLDETALKEASAEKMGRTAEETYYKLRGEEILKASGLSYAIVRVSGYNESPSSEASTIELTANNDDIRPISRAEVAQICVSALLDPNALNKSFYASKQTKEKASVMDESISAKFQALPVDTTVQKQP